MFVLIVALVVAIVMTTGFLWERRDWNSGICRANGLPWTRFDTDSQGGRGYVAGDEYTWISWPVDRKRVR